MSIYKVYLFHRRRIFYSVATRNEIYDLPISKSTLSPKVWVARIKLLLQISTVSADVESLQEVLTHTYEALETRNDMAYGLLSVQIIRMPICYRNVYNMCTMKLEIICYKKDFWPFSTLEICESRRRKQNKVRRQ